MHILICPDKLKGTATAPEVAAAIAAVCAERGHTTEVLPLADGGDGTLDALGGPNRTTVVTGPLGAPVEAGWRLDGTTAVIESARASGLALLEGQRLRPLDATSAGTGQLVRAAVEAGATRVLVTVGGSAMTDGGAPAVEAIGTLPDGVALTVACDVTTRFEDAAREFGPQKGATPDQVENLTRRLGALRRLYVRRFGVDVGDIPGAGAAGGLAGGLAALGARLVPGFDLVADAVGLDAAIGRADLVVTGEGLLDATSFAGKVVGSVAEHARAAGVPVAAVVGDVAPGTHAPFPVVSLVETSGRDRALTDTLAAVREATARLLAAPTA